MHVKRYLAPSLEQAIAAVKAELGPDALVLSTRRVRRDRGVFGWLGRAQVEVVAAAERARRRDAAPPAEPDPSWRPLALTQALLDPLEAELRALRGELAALRAAPGGGDALARELAALREALEGGGRAGAPPDPLCARLEAAGLAPRHARALAASAARAPDGDPRAALPRLLAERLDARLAPPREDGPPVALLVGAPGVGKTTTAAKLAARAAGERVALVSTDVHRHGGAEALRAFAAERGIAFAPAASPDELARALARRRGERVVVDTDGVGRGEAARLAELGALRAALGPRARVLLVLSATTREDALRAELERFAPLAPDALVATRADESERLAPLGNLLLEEATPPLAWIGTGRRVPDDLAVPTPEALAERVLGVAA